VLKRDHQNNVKPNLFGIEFF